MFPCFSLVKKSELTYLCVDDYIGFFFVFCFCFVIRLRKTLFPSYGQFVALLPGNAVF